MLAINNIEVVYEKVILAVHGVSLTVEDGQVVALLGANGAGKSSTLKAISSLVGAERGEVVSGSIVYRGQDITGAPPDVLVRDRLVQVLEGRHCFPHLSVEENLIAGSLATGGSRQSRLADLERIYQYFPRLKERRRVAAGYTSGGEQQMVAIGRALLSRPRLLLLDEPLSNLDANLREEMRFEIKALQRELGITILYVTHDQEIALAIADRAYLLEEGRIVAGGTPDVVFRDPALRRAYLGVGAGT